MTSKDKWIKLPGQKGTRYSSNRGKSVSPKVTRSKGPKDWEKYCDTDEVE